MAKGQAVQERSVRTGYQQDYIQGLNHLRTVATDLDIQIDVVKRRYYGNETIDDDVCEAYLKQTNDRLLYCNNKLRKHEKPLQVIDSELKLVTLLNVMRELAEIDNIDGDIVTYLTGFWDHQKSTLDQLTSVTQNYRKMLLKKLKQACVNTSGKDNATDSLTMDYTNHVNKFCSEIEQLLNSLDQLVRSYDNGLKQDLFSNTNFSNRILLTCDRKAFPILCIVPDLTEKLTRCVSLAKQWIDKDETYVMDIHNHIREARNETRKKEADLRNQKQRKDKLDKTVQEAFKQFQAHKTRLAKLDNELQTLEEQMLQYTEAKKYKAEEKKQKEGIVSFLEISITQTKKNFTLQLKRSRLMRQLRELEENLKMIENEMKSMQVEKEEKNEKKQVVQRKVEQSSSTYKTVKIDLDKLQAHLEMLEKEVEELTDSLTDLETIETFKTSPERVEDFYDRPSTVKIAPSLREKILLRKRKMNSKMSNDKY